MKNHLNELNKLFKETEELFEAFGWFKRKPQNQTPSASSLQQHQQAIETGNECAPGKSNGRFSSELGSSEATFYSVKDKRIVPTGFVKNIKPFLDNSGMTKRMMRCYDLVKDKMKIAWLFNGEFNADVLDWDRKKKKVIFQGTWKSGTFGGMKAENPNEKPESKPAVSPMQSKYYILRQGTEIGPYKASDIVTMMRNNTVNGNTIVRPENAAEYNYVSKDKTLQFILKSAAPAQPAAPARGRGNRNLGRQLP